MPDDIRVLIADDHPVVRSGLRAMLERCTGITVVGEARDGDEAVTMARQLKAGVVVMDLNMPGQSGETATARITKGDPTTAVLVLTMHHEDQRIADAIRAGARGYVLKGAEPDDLILAIRALGRGETVFGDRIGQRLAALLNGAVPTNTDPFPTLTQREREILALLAGGAANPEIARKLHISPKTVRNSLSTILVKICARDRADAILRARAAGLGQTSR